MSLDICPPYFQLPMLANLLYCYCSQIRKLDDSLFRNQFSRAYIRVHHLTLDFLLAFLQY